MGGYFAPRKSRRLTIIEWAGFALILLIALAYFLAPLGGDTPRSVRRAATLSHAKLLGLVFLVYAVDKGRLPNLIDQPGLEKDLEPYVNDASPHINIHALWRTFDPPQGRLVFNGRLAGVDIDRLAHPDQTMLVYANQPDVEGKRAICFADGHARWISGDQWLKLLVSPVIEKSR